ncbi:MAG: hypothetical protein GWP19_00395 [Planctomycetia bacterium]|nr:hypothetical protein [Planctomycetia bacterium]
MAVSANLKQIIFQSNLRSKPVRENYTDIETDLNDLQNQINNLTTPPVGSEVTNARDYHTVLRDRLRSASKLQLNKVIIGGMVQEQGTPDMTVQVSAGEAIINGVACKWSAGNSATITAPTLKRWDIVVIASDNTLSIVSGNDSNNRILPVITINQRPLGLIDLDSSTTTITDSLIVDISEQGCIVDSTWFFKIQDAIDYLDDRTNAIEQGEIIINKGEYYEEIDLSGKNNITLNFKNGNNLYRIYDSAYCIKNINASSNETIGIKIIGVNCYGNGITGSLELLKFDYVDEFLIKDCRFDGNDSSFATYKNWVIDNADNFHLDNNLNLDNSGDMDYSTTNITNATNYMEDGYYKNQVSFCGVTAEKAQMLKQGWIELTAMDDKYLRIDKDTAASTGGSDTQTVAAHAHELRDDGAPTHYGDEGDRLWKAGGGNTTYIATGSGTTLRNSLDYKTDSQSPLVTVTPAYYTLIALIHR